MEGAGSYGAGLTAFLQARGERVVEIGWPKRPARRTGAKSDALDAIRAARDALAQDNVLAPRRRGDRGALRVLLTTRQGACAAKVCAINQLKALIVGAPEELRAELEQLVAGVAPWLLELPGTGPISAAQVLVSWSHAGRLRSEAAFAALAGANPIPASSGQVTRHRLNRSGDRQLNRALHTIVLARLRDDPRPAAMRLGGDRKARAPAISADASSERSLGSCSSCWNATGGRR